MRHECNYSSMRRLLCAAFLFPTLAAAIAGCSGPSYFSKTKSPSREEELVKTLNEERKRAQYYAAQYEQALARLDGKPETREKSSLIANSTVKRQSNAFTPSPRDASNNTRADEQFISMEAKSPKVLTRLANSVPGLRLSPDKTWAKLDVDLLFGGGSEDLSASANDLLSDLAKTLSQDSAGDVRVLVVGYSDTQRGSEDGAEETEGGEDATWKIAADRAVNVVRKLTQSGVTADRLSAMSRGAQDPVAGNDTPTARAQNRRVEIYLLERDSTWAPDWTAALR
jgi:flagellar motor protein MotB